MGAFEHNHEINSLSDMKVSIDDKNKIVEKLKEGVSFQIILQTAPEFLTSHKGKYELTNGYLCYLQKAYITHIFNEKTVSVHQNLS